MKWIIISVIAITAVVVYQQFPEAPLTATKIDKLVVWKSKGIMEVYANGQVAKVYHVSIGQNSEGHKEREGDKRTPEGSYTINAKNSKSQYHKNLGISYPGPGDIRRASEKGVSPGGDVKIHGIRNGLGVIGKFHRVMNWTAGCIAVTNDEMDELFAYVDIGTPIQINP